MADLISWKEDRYTDERMRMEQAFQKHGFDINAIDPEVT